jgi:ribosome modulation factor
MDQQLLRQAFNEGFAACRAGKSNIDNPYTADDGLAEAWNDGWFAWNTISDLPRRRA